MGVLSNRYELHKFDLPDIKTILDVCGSLVTIDDASNIRFAHLTVQEYLVRKSIIPKGAESQMSITCTTYLSFNVFAKTPCLPCGSWGAKKAWHASHPFLEYSCAYLCSHLNKCDEDIPVEIILRFLKSPGSVSYYYAGTRDQPSLLHIASAVGHYQAVQQLLNEGADICATSS